MKTSRKLSNTKLCCPLNGEIAIQLIPNQDLLIPYPIKYHPTTDSCWDHYLHCVTQVALASLECVQPAVLLSDEQSASLLSFPVQPMFVKEIGPVPWPNAALDCAVASANKIVRSDNCEIECRMEIWSWYMASTYCAWRIPTVCIQRLHRHLTTCYHRQCPRSQ